MKKIHVGFLLSYDYIKLKNSIPPVYKMADKIFIAVDHEFRTWAGQKFEVEATFFDWLKEYDTEGKIELYYDNFYEPELSAIENDNRERHLLSLKMGIGNWLVQIDSDEYFINFENFVKDLRKYDHFLDNPEKTKIQIAGFLINMYKYSDGGVFFVKKPTRVLAATNYPNYKVARQTKQRIIYTPNILWHETLAREEKDIEFKLKNWGHNVDVDIEKFMDKWRSVNISNYKNLRDFFYVNPKRWKKLEFVKGENITEVSRNLDANKYLPNSLYIAYKNFEQWIKFLFKK